MHPEAIAILVPLGFFAAVVMIALGRPYFKAMQIKFENEGKQARIPPDVMNRLERIEQSVDAIAVEVERISEGQRFTTKLLSEVRSSAALPASSAQRDARGS